MEINAVIKKFIAFTGIQKNHIGKMKHPLDDIRLLLEKSAPHYGNEKCSVCNGLGIVMDPSLLLDTGIVYRLCDCVEEMTLCDRNPPYEYYDHEEKVMKECPSKKARMALKKILFLEKNSGIPEKFRNKFLISIDPDVLHDSTGNFIYVIDYVYSIIQDYPVKKGDLKGLYFYGKPGVGKTLLSCIILNELIRLYQVPVRYAKISRDIIGKIRDSFNPQSDMFGEARRIEEEFANIDVLVIDDFGVHRETPWVNNVLYDLIDARYEKKLLTIFTSNESMESWKEIAGGRLYSRLKEMCHEIRIDAEDYRLRNTVTFS